MKGEPLQILLVEDNEDHAELVRRSFQSHQVANNIHHVADGEVALDYLLRRGAYRDPKTSPKPDVILLDLRLPKMDGLEVLTEIKKTEELLKIPVVILTSSHEEQDVAKAYRISCKQLRSEAAGVQKVHRINARSWVLLARVE